MSGFLSLPNALTFGRLAATPAVLILAQMDSRLLRWLAWCVLLAALLTDVVDGLLARRFGWVSKLGVYFDPAVDKVVLLCGFFQLSHWGWLPLWIPMLLLGRELIVNAMRSGAAIEGKVVAANWMGKTKAFLMSSTLVGGYWLRAWYTGIEVSAYWLSVLYLLAVVTTVLSLFFACIFLYWQREVFKGTHGRGD